MKKITVFMIIAMMLLLTACGTRTKTNKPTVSQEVKATISKSEPTERPTERPTEKATEKPTEAPKNPPTEAPTNPPTEKPKDTAWKNLYIDFLDSLDQSLYDGFQLIYIDDDENPEIAAIGMSHIVPSYLCWVNQDELCKDNISFTGFAYFERQNKYLSEEGYTGSGWDHIRRISGSEAEEIMKGDFCTVQGSEYYRWDGVDYANLNEYEVAKANDFNKNAAKTVDSLESYTDICNRIHEY